MIEVCVPMRDLHHLTKALLGDLCADPQFGVLRVFDNGSVHRNSVTWLNSLDVENVEVVRRPNSPIYRMWNEALWELAEPGAHVAVLNNDIRVPVGFLGYLSEALSISPPDVVISYPDWKGAESRHCLPTGQVVPTQGTRNLGGMCGYGFMVDVDACRSAGVPPIDESFEWLCGDGDLIQQVQARGLTAAKVEGLGIEHVGSATSRVNQWTRGAIRRDRARRSIKYG